MRRKVRKPQACGLFPCRPSISVDAIDLLQPLFHRLPQVIARPAEFGIAASNKILLLALQLALLPGVLDLAKRPQIRGVDLAVEIGKFGIGADRPFHRAPRGSTIETRLSRYRLQRTQPLQLQR